MKEQGRTLSCFIKSPKWDETHKSCWKGVRVNLHKEKHQACGSVCMHKPAEETKVPPFLAEGENGSSSKRYKWNHYARSLHTLCKEQMRCANENDNKQINRAYTSLRKEQEALWEWMRRRIIIQIFSIVPASSRWEKGTLMKTNERLFVSRNLELNGSGETRQPSHIPAMKWKGYSLSPQSVFIWAPSSRLTGRGTIHTISEGGVID